MACHNGLSEAVPFTNGKFAALADGIGCEQCHGPGSAPGRPAAGDGTAGSPGTPERDTLTPGSAGPTDRTGSPQRLARSRGGYGCPWTTATGAGRPARCAAIWAAWMRPFSINHRLVLSPPQTVPAR